MADINVSVGVVMDTSGLSDFDAKLAKMSGQMATQFGTTEISTKGLEDALSSVAQVINKLDGNVNKLGDGIGNLGSKSNDAEKAVTRQVFAQRAALSSANNLTRSFTQLATGSGGAAASFGIVARQLALLSTSAAGTGITLKALASSFLGPAGIAIGISVAITAITGFISASGKKKKAVEDLNTSLEKYIQNLDAIGKALLTGDVNAAKETTSLNILYEATQRNSVALSDRKDAVKSLQDKFPKYFASLTEEQILAGEGKIAYDKLTASIIASAKARSAEQDIGKIAGEQRQLAISAKDVGSQLVKVQQEMLKQKAILVDQNNIDRIKIEAARKISNLGQEERRIQAELLGLADKSVSRDKESVGLREEIFNLIKDGADILQSTKKDTYVKKTKEEIATLTGSLKDFQNQKAKLEERRGREVDPEAIKKYTTEISVLDDKILKLTKTIKALSIVSDLAVQGSTPDTKLLEDSMKNSLEDLSKFRAILNNIRGKGSFDPFDLKNIKGSELNNLDRNKAAGTDKTSAATDIWLNQKKGFEEAAKANIKGANDFSRVLSRGFHKAGQDLMSMLTTFNEMEEGADKSFNAIFATLTKGLLSSFNDLFLRIISDKIKNNLINKVVEGGEAAGSALNQGANKLTVAAAGVALAGSVVSGVFKKTSSGGQALGGALSGAGTGAIAGSVVPGIGTAVGAIVGGAIGALGGIFGAKSARKQEKLQEEELAEQKKQTALMERQSALAFMQSIVGRMVEGVGIVNNADINFKGELVAKVAGKDILFVLERAEADKKRGK